jgi:hypothetical protein
MEGFLLAVFSENTQQFAVPRLLKNVKFSEVFGQVSPNPFATLVSSGTYLAWARSTAFLIPNSLSIPLEYMRFSQASGLFNRFGNLLVFVRHQHLTRPVLSLRSFGESIFQAIDRTLN